MKNKLIIIVATLLLALAWPAMNLKAAEPNPVPIEVFVRPSCPHCQAEETYLQQLQTQRADIVVTYHDITNDGNYQQWLALTELQDLPKVTPITLVGSIVVQGFDSEQTTGKLINDLVDQQLGQSFVSLDEFIAAGNSQTIADHQGATCDDGQACEVTSSSASISWSITLPFFGVIDLRNYSLPSLSVILGFVDGFNPCAMWVLVTFLIVLAQLGSRKKMIQVAGLFIIAESVMYYLILNVWFKTWNFVGLDRVVTPIVGLLAIGGGLFFLYEWYKHRGTCQVTNSEQKSKIKNKISNLVSSPLTIATAIGVIGLALSVNVIEFACSIGVPQAYTKIIELNHPSFWLGQWYMFLYILFYMVDDFVVFSIALYSFDKIGVTTKYSAWSNLIGGILMIILGLILIFQRQWLIFA
ncbi:MAG: glutaredoxin [Candidatus Buchananbacteria bacterium]|nr:glutaredoxin [Candidatus Buchananbacteria bacterium]